MSREFMLLGLRLLDEQLVDSTGRRCGRVEDLEFDAPIGQPAALRSMLCGATAWKRRLPPSFAQLIPGDPRGLRRVPLDAVAKITNEVELHLTEGELARTDVGERPAFALSELMGIPVIAPDGRKLGRIRDAVASRESGESALWKLEGLLVGRLALWQRLGVNPDLGEEMAAGDFPENMIAWERVETMDDEGCIRLRR